MTKNQFWKGSIFLYFFHLIWPSIKTFYNKTSLCEHVTLSNCVDHVPPIDVISRTGGWGEWRAQWGLSGGIGGVSLAFLFVSLRTEGNNNVWMGKVIWEKYIRYYMHVVSFEEVSKQDIPKRMIISWIDWPMVCIGGIGSCCMPLIWRWKESITIHMHRYHPCQLRFTIHLYSFVPNIYLIRRHNAKISVIGV